MAITVHKAATMKQKALTLNRLHDNYGRKN